MKFKTEFYNENKKFFENGYLKEIYGNDNCSILNVCNSLYAATRFQKLNNGNYVAMIVGKEQIQHIIEDDRNLALWISGLSREELKKIIIEFKDETYDIMKGIKARTDIEGPTKYIDLEFEESLKQKSR